MNSTDLVHLEDALTRLTLAPALGGALVAWTRQSDNLNLLRPSPPDAASARQLGCYPLVPWSNRISNGGFDRPQGWQPLTPNSAGDELPIHGSGWQQPWGVVAHDATSVTLQLDSRTPFAYRAQQRISLKDGQLTIELEVTHQEEAPCWYGLGLHPYFPRTAGSELQITAATVWQRDEGSLPTVQTELPEEWNFHQAKSLPDHLVDNGFTGWNGTALIRQPDLGYHLHMRATGSEYFLLFCPEEKPFFCVEPVSHPVNAHHLPERPGLRLLAQGETAALGMSLQYQPLP